MYILYISKLSGRLNAGPTYSVPKQVGAQAKYDDVFWYNLTISEREEWKRLDYYADIADFPNGSFKDLPSPFNRPDLIVIEQLYDVVGNAIIKEIVKSKIPYVIIPRSEFTKKAQRRKWYKKKIANFLICNKYAKKAASIHYLTRQEYEDSGDKWNKNHFIIPNGINIPRNRKVAFSTNGIKCIFLGRVEPYQKGLDLLIEACGVIKNNLLDSRCSIIICGPNIEKKKNYLVKLIHQKGLSSIVQFKDAVYSVEKEQALVNSDVFVLTSRFEGLSMALLEALSYGVPCIVTPGTNFDCEIGKYDAGWTASCSKEGIASAFLSMLKTSPSEWKTKSENALLLANNFQWEKIALNSHIEYKKILKL